MRTTKSPKTGLAACALGACLLISGGLHAHAAMNRGPQKPADDVPSPVEQARALAESGKCHDALQLLTPAASDFAEDPEYHNLRGYCLRKTGELQAAFASYERALSLRPRYPQAREYLAEAHLDAVLQELRALRDYGPDAREDLHTLVRHLVETAEGLRREFPQALEATDAPPRGKRW